MPPWFTCPPPTPLQTALLDTSRRLQDSETQCLRAVSRVQDLEAELAAAQQQGSASVGAWEQERASLQERCTRLQKVNQTRRQEMDELQAKLVVAHNAASNTTSVRCLLALLRRLVTNDAHTRVHSHACFPSQ